MSNEAQRILSRAKYLSVWGDTRSLSVGVLGGSFNPAHEGHVLIAEQAIKRLGLDQVWFLVSPQNPLKSSKGTKPFQTRLDTVRRILPDKRMLAVSLEQEFGTRYSYEVVHLLRQRFPNIRFVWLMGADSLESLNRWKNWKEIVKTFPLAVFARPGMTNKALHSEAANYMRTSRVRSSVLKNFVNSVWQNYKPGMIKPWVFIPFTHSIVSSTAIRDIEKRKKK